jgi:hypothetical protein
MDDCRSIPGRGGNFSLHCWVQTGSGAHPASYPLGIRGSFLGVKWLDHEAGHSLPTSAQVRNAWSYMSTPPYILMAGVQQSKGYVFMAWCLVKIRDNSTSTCSGFLFHINYRTSVCHYFPVRLRCIICEICENEEDFGLCLVAIYTDRLNNLFSSTFSHSICKFEMLAFIYRNPILL